ncbi:TonB-dependent receptor [Colwellia sp. D2M02]|uniref:TonB-dependent receptor n=1 Tax=Colwellia sp. D2M02 TaxID=2841562 RepID=UPI00209131FE|nr:TonB-dependent receptor [Colwellia sp. D2M02]
MSKKLTNLIKNNTAMRFISFSTIALTGAMGNVYAAEAADNNLADKSDVEIIQVKGIRGSLTRALNSKRFSDSVLDSISAEDIGKFPDKNIGDAMQRIPGVTVVRTYGEVSGVTVRGTAPEHSMVLLNGQNVASVGWFDLGGINRSFNFEMLASEQVSGMDLYKSVEADVNEGAIGGTVNLKTRKPLELDAGTVFASVEGAYHENSEEWDPAYSALGSWKTDDETFGILVAYSNEQSKVYRETLSNFGTPSGSFTDSNGVSHNSYGAMSSILFDEDRERTSSQITVQYAPTDNLLIGLNYNLFELNNDHINTAQFGIVGFGTLDGNSTTTNNAGVLTQGTTNGANGAGLPPLFNNTVLRKPEMQTDALNFTLEYTVNDWSIGIVAGSSSAEGRTLQSSTWWGDTTNAANGGYTYDVAGALEIIPTNSDYMSSHSNFDIFQEFTYINYVRDNDIDYIQSDFTYQLDKGMFTTLDFGLKYQSQTFASRGDYRDVDVNKAIADGLNLSDYNGGFVSGLHSKEGRPGSLSAFPVADGAGIWDYAYQNQADTTTTLSQFSIEEDITAFYVKGNFEGDGFRGNVGLRYVGTDVLSKGSIDGLPSQGKKDYSNFLPSVNIAADISDDLIFRFAAGSTISRPDYDAMQMAETISVSFATATVGSPNLEPYKADQYDIGLEWYFDEASIVGATFFIKNISDYIETTAAVEPYDGCSQTCLVTRSRNVGTGDVTGLELQIQHAFDNGFGVQGNYTYTDSERTTSDGKIVPLDDVSKNSFNLSAYYEDDNFSARLAYNYRDEFMRQYNNSGSASVNDAYSQLDASVIWHAMDNLDISLEAVNLTNEALVLRQPDFGNVVHSIDEFGTRYFLGASIKF